MVCYYFILKEVYIMNKLFSDIYVTIGKSYHWVDDFCQTIPYWNEGSDNLDRMDTYGIDYEDADINIGILWSERLA